MKHIIKLYLVCPPGRIVILVITALLFSLITQLNLARAQSFSEVQKIIANDGTSVDFFGNSVSIDGNCAIVGAIRDDGFTGSAYIFEKDGSGNWIQKQKIGPSDGELNCFFGRSVFIRGDYALIGASVCEGQRGATFIFHKNSLGTWVQEQRIIASDGAAGDQFGWSCSMSGDYLIVGANEVDGPLGYETGAVYFFHKNGSGVWEQQHKFTVTDGNGYNRFGSSVSMFGDYTIIGADGDNSAYIYKKDAFGNWIEQQKLLPSASDPFAEFGWSVMMEEDYAVIGANRDLGLQGSAFVFKKDVAGIWVEQQKITASDGEAFDFFGTSVAINGNVIIVGAYFDDDIGDNAGAAYMYNKNSLGTWIQQQKITTSDGELNDHFGWSVSISGNNAIIGAFRDNNYQGSAYFFMKDCLPIDIETDASCKTIYNGYGDPCAELTASATGGYGTLSYTWSPGNLSGSTVEVCPTETTTYTVTVTDGFGCTSSSEVTVEVVDVRCGNKGDKVQICHKGQVQCVAPNAVAAHLAHGDNLGSCGFVPCDGAPDARIGVESLDNPILTEIKLRAYPNPTDAVLRLQIEATQPGEAQVDVLDLIGRPLIQRKTQMVQGTNELTLNLQALPNGIYLIRCRDAFMHQGVLRVSKY